MDYPCSIPYDEVTVKFRETLFNSASYLDEDELKLLEKAAAYSYEAHQGQFRRSGEPYITHPMSVATEVAYWREDIHTLIAALLHDVLEDTGVTKTELAEKFGQEIADIVDGLSKLDKLEGKNYTDQQAESFQKLILAVVDNLRVLVIKLADRLHNMRTLGILRPDKQRRIAKETLEIFAQLANRIGMNSVYQELEDLSFKYLYPNRYYVVKKALYCWRMNNKDLIESILRNISLQLISHNVEAMIIGKEKNVYAIFKKMQNKKLRFSEVMDIYGFKVVVHSLTDCYRALGALHTLYKPKPGTFKDYIAIPKKNGYQSLHTTLINKNGQPMEVQIYSKEMNKLSESGLSNRFFELTKSVGIEQTKTGQWFKNIMELRAQSDNAVEFFENIKVDLFPDEVYVFTPKGKIIVLPQYSSPIDFAYAIHTDVGHHCMGAKVNNTFVPLRHRLNSGDIVEISTSPGAKPNPAWLSFVVSARARSAIRNKLKNMNREDAITLGEKLLQKVLSILLPSDVIFSDYIRDEYLVLLDKQNITFQDILYDVGMGRRLPMSVALEIAQFAGKQTGEEVKLTPILISGSENASIHLAACCNPIPGDGIKAAFIKDQGLVVHREMCPNLLKVSPEKQLDSNWDSIAQNKKYKVRLLVTAKDARGLLALIANAISNNAANIDYVETPSQKESGLEGFIEFIFGVEIQNGLSQLKKIIRDVGGIAQVNKIIRK